MSSIKYDLTDYCQWLTTFRQVQDLQNQLADAKMQINHLQKMVQDSTVEHVDSTQAQSLKLPALGYRSATGNGPPPLNNFDPVRKSIRTYSRGVFKVPPMYRPYTLTPTLTSQEVTLPARHLTDTLLSQFFNYYNIHRPFIYWMAFIQQVDRAYQAERLHGNGIPQVWVAMFFATLACGSLHSPRDPDTGLNPDKDGIQYMVIGSRLLNTWTDNLSVDHARTSLMISIFLTEQNIRSAGWIWLGSGLRISQDVGLHLEHGPWSQHEGDCRRMVYWAIFSYDRSVSFTLNCGS
jgi:hypothetical protein